MATRTDWDALRAGLERARLAEQLDVLRAHEASQLHRRNSRRGRRRTDTPARTPQRSGGGRT